MEVDPGVPVHGFDFGCAGPVGLFCPVPVVGAGADFLLNQPETVLLIELTLDEKLLLTAFVNVSAERCPDGVLRYVLAPT